MAYPATESGGGHHKSTSLLRAHCRARNIRLGVDPLLVGVTEAIYLRLGRADCALNVIFEQLIRLLTGASCRAIVSSLVASDLHLP